MGCRRGPPAGAGVSGPRFATICADWPLDKAAKHVSREAAERALAAIERQGACHLPHEIVEVER
jgi:hypothetical protein